MIASTKPPYAGSNIVEERRVWSSHLPNSVTSIALLWLIAKRETPGAAWYNA